MEGPDGGYSWVVVVCCAFIHFALFGIFRSAGVIYVAMLQAYDVTREEASWPFALAAGIFQITGPLASILTHYVSQRKAMIFGCFIATIGLACCYFAQSILWINIFYGVVHGIGFGIALTLIAVTLNQYFLKYRATAIGFSFSGGSISSLLFPLVMEWLLENYSLNESFLLLSGVVMNTMVAASLLKAPSWLKEPKMTQTFSENSLEARDSGVSTSPDYVKNPSFSNVYEVAPQADPEDFSDILDSESIERTSRNSSVTKMNNFSDGQPTGESLEVDDTLRSNNDSVLFGGSYSSSNVEKNTVVRKNELEVQEPLIGDNKKIFIIPKKDKSETAQRLNESKVRYSLSSILKQPVFYKLAFTMIVYFLGIHSTFMVIVDFAKDKGIPENKGVYILSMFSLTDLFGRAGLGWVTDRNFVSRTNMISVNLAILGVVYELYPLIDSLTGILAIAAVQGLAVGCSITLFFVIQAERMGLENLTLVIGLTSFINGVASFLRPAIIGLFRDVIGSYDWMFHIFGAITLIVAFMWFAESYRARSKSPSNTSCDDKM